MRTGPDQEAAGAAGNQGGAAAPLRPQNVLLGKPLGYSSSVSSGGLTATGHVHRGDVLDELRQPGLPLNSTSMTSRSSFSSMGASVFATVLVRARCTRPSPNPRPFDWPEAEML